MVLSVAAVVGQWFIYSQVASLTLQTTCLVLDRSHLACSLLNTINSFTLQLRSSLSTQKKYKHSPLR